jgi:hypothetical protein
VRRLAVTDATGAYRADCDTLGRFLEDCCILGATEKVNQADFRTAWEDWHTAHGSKRWALRT